MVTKYLKAGGDYTTMAQLNTALQNALIAGLADDWTVYSENAATFSEVSLTLAGSLKFNGYTILITSDPATPASPSIWAFPDFSGLVNINDSNAAADTGGIIIEKMILKKTSASGYPFANLLGYTLKAGRFCYVRDNLIYAKDGDGESPGTFSLQDLQGGSSSGTFNFIGNSLYLASTASVDATGISLEITSLGMVANNFIGCYKFGSLSVTTGKNDTNHAYAYNGLDAFSVGGTATNLTRGVNPNTNQAVIQANYESIATMAARNARTTVASAALIGKANVTYQTTTDLERNNR